MHVYAGVNPSLNRVEMSGGENTVFERGPEQHMSLKKEHPVRQYRLNAILFR